MVCFHLRDKFHQLDCAASATARSKIRFRASRMTFLNKITISVFSACLLPIAITSGYWAPRPHSYSSCDLLEGAVPFHPNKPASRRQLRHDAEFVEDLGIRYADARFGPHSGHFENMEDYGRRRDTCIAQLFQGVARNDDVTEDQVRASLNQRPIECDVAAILSLIIVYSWATGTIAFRIWHLQRQDKARAKVVSVYAAVLLGLAFVMVGGLWCDTMETIRLGNGHESYRGERVPWTHHYYLEYVAGVAIFCGAVMLQQRAARLESSIEWN